MGPRVLVLAKRTSYRTLVLEQEDELVTRLLEDGDAAVAKMRRSHDSHEETVREVDEALAALGATVDQRVGPRTPIDGRYDLVVTVGGDGTLLAASHQLGPETPLLGVNSAPESSVGFFCAACKGSVLGALRAALDGSLVRTTIARMRVDRQRGSETTCLHRRVLNEALFCHPSPAATSRYVLRIEQPSGAVLEEDQRSSGLWIGPAAGSTAAQHSAGGQILPLASRELQFVVREPYVRVGSSLALRQGLVEDGGSVHLLCKMRDARLFFDGHNLAHEIVLGDRLVLRRSEENLTLVGIAR